MKQLMAQFAATLRSAGIPVSTAEVLDATRALDQLHSPNRTTFQTALKTTLVKSQRHLPTFDRCFDLFFAPDLHHTITKPPTLPPTDPQSSGNTSPSTDLSHLEEAWQTYRRDAASTPPSHDDPTPFDAERDALREALVALLERGDPAALEQLRGLATGELATVPDSNRDGSTSGLLLLGRRLQAMTVIEELRDALRRFAQTQATAAPLHHRPAIPTWLARREAQLDRATALLTDRVRARPTRTFIYRERHGLAAQGLAAMAIWERERLVEIMQRFVRKVATVHSRRLRRRQHGQLDVKKTLRASLRTGGVPITLHHRRRRHRKGNLIVLCDVSGSVRTMAQATLAMIHALAAVWESIQVFAFTDHLEDISTRFDHYDPEQVVRQIMDEPLLSSPRPSNYGRAFRQFEHDHGHTLTPRTTLMILGDARNNGHLTEHHLVERWQRRARRVLWLNPEPVEAWDTGDSEASAYRPFCTEFCACTTLGQLEAFVERLYT